MNTRAGIHTGATQPGGSLKNGKELKTGPPQTSASADRTPKRREANTGGAEGKSSKAAFAPPAKGSLPLAGGRGPDAASVVEKLYRPPNILRLPGIRLSDFKPPEDTLDERLLESVEAAEGRASPLGAEGVPYDKIPSEFTGLEDWPTSTNLKCWVCDFNFSDRPKFVALSFKENEAGGYKMGVHGVMCTFNCAELYIETHYLRLTERQHLQELLRFEYFFFTAKWVSRIRPAPSKTEMLQYGGHLDFDAFLKKLRELDPEHGLRDHTPGSILPERLRGNPGEMSGEAPVSVWDLCSVSAPTAAQRGDTASVWQLLSPGETKPGGANPLPRAETGPGEAKPGGAAPGKKGPDVATTGAATQNGVDVGARSARAELWGVEDPPVGGKTPQPPKAQTNGAKPKKIAVPSLPGPANLGRENAGPAPMGAELWGVSDPPVGSETLGGLRPPSGGLHPQTPQPPNSKPALAPQDPATNKDGKGAAAPPAQNAKLRAPAAKKAAPTVSKKQPAAVKAPAANDTPKALLGPGFAAENKEGGPNPGGACDYLDELLG
jgi:hypothetical protein